jgi:hypothetical protein
VGGRRAIPDVRPALMLPYLTVTIVETIFWYIVADSTLFEAVTMTKEGQGTMDSLAGRKKIREESGRCGNRIATTTTTVLPPPAKHKKK